MRGSSVAIEYGRRNAQAYLWRAVPSGNHAGGFDFERAHHFVDLLIKAS
jgi:hypothetical protein